MQSMPMSDESIHDPVLERVKDFLSKHLGVRKDGLAPSTRIEEDLGCSGDDALELMQAFGEQFNIDLCDFNPYLYFDKEGFDPIGCLLDLFRKGGSARRATLTLEDLVNAVRVGKWPDNR
jgi:acyl carrier protein